MSQETKAEALLREALAVIDAEHPYDSIHEWVAARERVSANVRAYFASPPERVKGWIDPKHDIDGGQIVGHSLIVSAEPFEGARPVTVILDEEEPGV